MTTACVCGGSITSDGDVEAAVRLHNATWRHQTWRNGGRVRHRCAGVGGSRCMVDIPADRDLCHWCRGTLRLARRMAA